MLETARSSNHTTVSALSLTIPNSRLSATPYNIELLEERMKDWSGTLFMSYLPLLFIALWVDGSCPLSSAPGLIPSHPLYLYGRTS